MSACMDANALQQLFIEATTELLAEEELVAIRETYVKVDLAFFLFIKY